MEVLVDAWSDDLRVITRPQKEVRVQSTEYQASHTQDALCVTMRELKLGAGEKNLGTPHSFRFWKSCFRERVGQ